MSLHLKGFVVQGRVCSQGDAYPAGGTERGTHGRDRQQGSNVCKYISLYRTDICSLCKLLDISPVTKKWPTLQGQATHQLGVTFVAATSAIAMRCVCAPVTCIYKDISGPKYITTKS
jgi:hypothetical protein